MVTARFSTARSSAACLALLASALVGAGCSAPGGGPGQVADHLFLGDHILTLDGAEASAVAVVGEEIAWVGDRDGAESWRGDTTVVHELGSRALMPGFVDAHGHLSFTSQTIDLANVASPPVGPAEDVASLQAELRAFIGERGLAAGEWVLGMGYDDSLLAEHTSPQPARSRRSVDRSSDRADPRLGPPDVAQLERSRALRHRARDPGSAGWAHSSGRPTGKRPTACWKRRPWARRAR